MRRLGFSPLAIGLLLVLSDAAGASALELVLRGGRVIDPESGLDGVRDVGIEQGRITAVSETPLDADEIVDVSGLIVAPGFIDLHVHGQNAVSYDYMARDGVTTALDLEAGVHGIASFLAEREGQARIHYGASAGHIGSRVKVKHGISSGHASTATESGGGIRGWFMRVVLRFFRPTAWIHEPANEEERQEITETLAEQLDLGAIGIGLGLAYTPGAEAEELRAVFALAAERGVPCFVHIRDQQYVGDLWPIDEVIGLARETGAALHVVHINSSSLGSIDAFLARVEAARAEGLDVTTEAYPYTAASTFIEAAIFDEGWRERRGIDYGDLQWVATGERLTEESFHRYREQGGTVIIHMMQPEWIEKAMAHPLVMIASDGMPMQEGAHPRGAGSHARVLALYARERGVIDWMQAISKLSTQPARRLQGVVPEMARKGRIRAGADADVTIFDPDTVQDQATFEAAMRPSTGIPHVLVGGTFVVRDGALVDAALPGRALRGAMPAEPAAAR